MRLWQVVREIVPALTGDPVTRGPRLAAAMGRLGGLMVYLGQYFSQRYDLLPASWCRSLAVLQAGEDGLTGKVCTVRREGARAIKEVRPETVAQFAADLAMLAALARLFGWALPRLRLSEMVAEMRRFMAEQTDLRFEAARQIRARKVLRRHGLWVPRVFAHESSSTRLEMEWVDGIRLREFISMDDADRRRAWAHPVRRLAKRTLRSYLRQTFEEVEVHVDLHQSNVMLTRTRIYIIDFGGMAQVDADFLVRFQAFVRALATRHWQHAAQLFCLLCDGLNTFWFFARRRVRRLQARLAEAMADWASKAATVTLSYYVRSINALTEALMLEVLKARGSMQWGWLRLQAGFTAIDGTIAALWPEVDYMRVAATYLRQAEKRIQLKPVNPAAVLEQLRAFLERQDERSMLDTSSLRIEGLLKGI